MLVYCSGLVRNRWREERSTIIVQSAGLIKCARFARRKSFTITAHNVSKQHSNSFYLCDLPTVWLPDRPLSHLRGRNERLPLGVSCVG